MIPLRGTEAETAINDVEKQLVQAQEWKRSDGAPVVLEIPSSYQDEHTPIVITPADGERWVIIADDGCEVFVLEKGSGNFSIDVVLNPNTTVKYASHTEKSNVRRFALLHDDASIYWIDAAYNGAVSNVISNLGKGANAEFHSVFIGTNEEEYDVRSSMIHTGDHSTSNMLTRSVLMGKSQGKYEGLIRIDANAAGCDAYQKEETILLSNEARMDATPNLEISNEDVRCSHGVSLGRLDEEKLFYFKSRAIQEHDAVTLIVDGFFSEILDKMEEHGAPVRSHIKNALEVRG